MSCGDLSPLLAAGLTALASTVLSLSALGTEAPAEPNGAGKKTEAPLRCLQRGEICVTHGAIGADAAGRLTISDPVVRAVSAIGISRIAELRFTFLGPTAQGVPLRSGQMRRQAGLKLRAQNGCNLVYVMWRHEPKNELVVSVKSNPGMRTNAQCGTHGYQNLVPLRATPPPVLRPGEAHRLRAMLTGRGDGLEVFIDDVSVWTGSLGPEAAAFDGPIGLRTDNVRLVADLCQSSEVAAAMASPPCTPTKED